MNLSLPPVPPLLDSLPPFHCTTVEESLRYLFRYCMHPCRLYTILLSMNLSLLPVPPLFEPLPLLQPPFAADESVPLLPDPLLLDSLPPLHRSAIEESLPSPFLLSRSSLARLLAASGPYHRRRISPLSVTLLLLHSHLLRPPFSLLITSSNHWQDAI